MPRGPVNDHLLIARKLTIAIILQLYIVTNFHICYSIAYALDEFGFLLPHFLRQNGIISILHAFIEVLITV